MRLTTRGSDEPIEERLRTERILWLGTTDADGAPHLVPVWFIWDGSAFIVFSKPGALKVRHISAEPRVAIALGEPEDDFDVQLVAARAELIDRTMDAPPPELVTKYGVEMDRIGLSPEEYAATYSQGIRIVPTRFLPWRGRTWLARRHGQAVSPTPSRTLMPAWA